VWDALINPDKIKQNMFGTNVVSDWKEVKRVIHDMTQNDLAKKGGVTRQTINAIELQKYDPSLSLAFKLTGLFDVRIEGLFKYEEE
jgi:putative transcriptional regulator